MMIPFAPSPLDAYRGSGKRAKVDPPTPCPCKDKDCLEEYFVELKKWRLAQSLDDHKLVKVANSTD